MVIEEVAHKQVDEVVGDGAAHKELVPEKKEGRVAAVGIVAAPLVAEMNEGGTPAARACMFAPGDNKDSAAGRAVEGTVAAARAAVGRARPWAVQAVATTAL